MAHPLPSNTFYGGNVVCGPVHLLVATSISHFLTVAIKFSYYSSNEIGPFLFFITGSGPFSVIQANVDSKIKSKERIGLVVVVFYL